MATSKSAQSFDLKFGSFLVSLASFMIVLNISKKPLEVVLVFGRALMLFSFERSVFDVGTAVFAPILGLSGDGQQWPVDP